MKKISMQLLSQLRQVLWLQANNRPALLLCKYYQAYSRRSNATAAPFHNGSVGTSTEINDRKRQWLFI